jgi:3-deoxy-manno-octulosonate cytidylyltransferase (CMP-KDO synthetase)
MQAAILLPARLASTRLPCKLLLDRTGRTVLEHTVARALEARALRPRLFRSILVACDDPRLAEAARRAGVQAVMTRPDHASGTDRLAEAVRKQRLKENLIVNLQADEPEMDPRNLVRVAELLAAAPRRAPVATLATALRDEETWRRPNVVKVVLDASGRDWGRALYFSRAPIPHLRDGAPRASGGAERPVYGFHHLGLYAYRREFLLRFSRLPASRLEQAEKLEQLRVLEAGYEILVGLAETHPPGIDTLEEYEAFVARFRSHAAETGVSHGER